MQEETPGRATLSTVRTQLQRGKAQRTNRDQHEQSKQCEHTCTGDACRCKATEHGAPITQGGAYAGVTEV